MLDEVIKIKIKTENGDLGKNSNTEEDVSWQFEERPIAPNNELLWALAIFGFAIIVFSIILKNYLFILIVVLTAFIIYILKNKAPEIHEFKLDSEGLHINKKIYPYENFESFWIFQDNEIALRNKRRLIPLLIVPFNSDDESEIKKILLGHLPENEEEESFLDLIRKRFF